MHGDQKTAHRMEAYLKEAEAVLVRHGGRVEPMPDPNPRSTWWRRAFGSEPAYTICVHRGGRWTVTNRWL
jgi:hypothetical protein